MNDKEKNGDYARLMERLAQSLNRKEPSLRQALGPRSSPVSSALTELSDRLVDECPTSDGPELRRFFQSLHAALSMAFLFGAAVEHDQPFVSQISDRV
jgi:hypothetical protein